MPSPTKYFITDTTSYFIVWQSNITSLPINTSLLVTGESGDDSVYVDAYTTVDASQLSIGANKIYLTGNFDDYTQSHISQIYTLIRKGTSESDANLEKIIFKLFDGDKLYFADGFLKLGTDEENDIGNVGFNKDLDKGKLNTSEKTPESLFTSNTNNATGSATKVYITDTDGGNIPGATIKNSKLIVTGESGDDNVYVDAYTTVDASQLSTGANKIYLTGNFDDYTQSHISQIYTLIRTSTSGATEKVIFKLFNGDKLYFADGFLKLGIGEDGGNVGFNKDLDKNKLNTSEFTPTAGLTIALEDDTGSSATDGITNNGKVNVSGLEANATWKYSKDGGATWADPSNTDNSFTLEEGDYITAAIQVKQFDAAGNELNVTKMAATTVDKTAPAFSSAATGIGIKGQNAEVYDAEVTGGDTGITYTITGTDAAKFTIGAADGKIKYDIIPTAETTTAHNITIIATDLAGNATTQDVAISVVSRLVGDSTIRDAQNIDVRSPIVLTFNEVVTANANFKITLTDTNDSDNDAHNGIDGIGWKLDKTQNNHVIALTDTAQVKIETVLGKSIVTIKPTRDFDFGTKYTINVDADAFTGASGKKSLAIDMAFETVTPKKDNIGTESQIQVSGVDALVSSNWWVDAHQSSITSSPINVIAGQEAVKDENGAESGLDKDIAIAISLNAVGRSEEEGNIRILGITNTKDIIYMDIDNVLSPEYGTAPTSYLTKRNWGDYSQDDAPDLDLVHGTVGARKTTSPENGDSAPLGVIYSAIPDDFVVATDARLFDQGHGAVLYG